MKWELIEVLRIRGSEAKPVIISNVEAKELPMIYEKNQVLNIHCLCFLFMVSPSEQNFHSIDLKNWIVADLSSSRSFGTGISINYPIFG